MLSGGNMENAAYPMCICAEGVILSSVESSKPNATIKAMAITVKSPSQVIDYPVSPCGSCRQMISEKENRQSTPIRIILKGESGPFHVFDTVKRLLPFSFSSDSL